MVKVVNLSPLGKYPTPRFSSSFQWKGTYLRVKLRRDPMEKEFSRYQTKIGPAFAEAANEMHNGTRPPAGHGQWCCASRRHSWEDGCCCAVGCGFARCAQNPGSGGVPGGAGEKQPEGRGVLKALAPARVALIPAEPLPVPRVKFRDSMGRSDCLRPLPGTTGASQLRWSGCYCPGACSRLPQTCSLQEVSAPFWELADCHPRISGPIMCTSFAPPSSIHHHTQQRFNLPHFSVTDSSPLNRWETGTFLPPIPSGTTSSCS